LAKKFGISQPAVGSAVNEGEKEEKTRILIHHSINPTNIYFHNCFHSFSL